MKFICDNMSHILFRSSSFGVCLSWQKFDFFEAPYRISLVSLKFLKLSKDQKNTENLTELAQNS